MIPFDKNLRIYADTSVFGGVFDDEFSEASVRFFDSIKQGKFSLLTSELVRDEIRTAPEKVKQLFEESLVYAEVVEISAEALKLQKAYLNASILTEKYSTDALHVALATVCNASFIVSWNFKHIVNFRKMHMYNVVNKNNGFEEIDIYSPLEVIEDED